MALHAGWQAGGLLIGAATASGTSRHSACFLTQHMRVLLPLGRAWTAHVGASSGRRQGGRQAGQGAQHAGSCMKVGGPRMAWGAGLGRRGAARGHFGCAAPPSTSGETCPPTTRAAHVRAVDEHVAALLALRQRPVHRGLHVRRLGSPALKHQHRAVSGGLDPPAGTRGRAGGAWVGGAPGDAAAPPAAAPAKAAPAAAAPAAEDLCAESSNSSGISAAQQRRRQQWHHLRSSLVTSSTATLVEGSMFLVRGQLPRYSRSATCGGWACNICCSSMIAAFAAAPHVPQVPHSTCSAATRVWERTRVCTRTRRSTSAARPCTNARRYHSTRSTEDLTKPVLGTNHGMQSTDLVKGSHQQHSTGQHGTEVANTGSPPQQRGKREPWATWQTWPLGHHGPTSDRTGSPQ